MPLESTMKAGTAVVIFSRDRALQLQGTLASLKLQCHEADRTPILVLYRATGPEFAESYRQLKIELAGELPITWIAEHHFKRDLLASLNGFGKSLRGVLFVVDDCLFIRPFSLLQLNQALEKDAKAIGYSLRLGRNTSWCYATDQAQASPDFEEQAEGLRFRWPGQEGDFGYPLELSSSLYRWQDLRPLLSLLPYGNPNRLEQGLARLRWAYAKRQPCLWCAEQSLAFCAPINKVQAVVDNRAGSCQDMGAAALNHLFLDGKRIAVEQLTNYSPKACHQEITLPLRSGQRNRPEPDAIAVLISTLPDVNPLWLEQSLRSTAIGLERSDAIWLRIDGGWLTEDQRLSLKCATAPVPLVIDCHGERQGLAACLNSLIDQVLADGRFGLVARMDADDTCHPDRFKLQRHYLAENPGVDILGSSCREVDEQGQLIQVKHMPLGHAEMVRCLPRRNVINHPSVVIRRTVLASGLRYRQDVSRMEDYHLWISATAAGWGMANLPELLLDYRRDRHFFRRRGGWRQARADLLVRWRAITVLNQWSLINLALMMGAGMMRLMPGGVQAWLYRRRGVD